MFNRFMYYILLIFWQLIKIVLIYILFKLIVVWFRMMKCCKNKKHCRHNVKFKLKHYFYHLKYEKFVFLIDFIKWVVIDLIKGKDKFKLFGIWAFTGYYGEGKTFGCVEFANMLKEKHPERDIHIFSNIYVKGSEKVIKSWDEILSLPKNSIVIYDESQSDWSCNLGSNDFPDDLLRRITTCRKKQLALFMTSPVFGRMNINIRESVNFVITCKNILGVDRWFRYVFYRTEDFEKYQENSIKLLAHRYMFFNHIATDKDYRRYHTLEEVGSLKVIDNDKDNKRIRNEMYKLNRNIDKKIQKII